MKTPNKNLIICCFALALSLTLASPVAAQSSVRRPANPGSLAEAGVYPDGVELLNWARSVNRMCGDERMGIAPLVSWHEDLALAALDHAADVVVNNVRGHQGSDGSSLMQRIRRYSPDFFMAGENIHFAGYSKYLAVSGWLRSPPHCSNIMNEGITHVGLAYARNPETNRLIWVLKIGTPRGNQPERVILPPYDVAPLRGRDVTVFISGSRVYNSYAHNLGRDLQFEGIDHELKVVFEDPVGIAIMQQFNITDIQQLTNIILVDNEVYEGAYTVRQLLDLMKAGDRLGMLVEG